MSQYRSQPAKPETRRPVRVDWVDHAKGFCIIMVVMMHSTLGMGETIGAEGWLHAAVEFARPFRMPDFFLISGLFLANVIDRDWRLYLDRKVVHFFYFYLLWVAIQFAFKTPFYLIEGMPIAEIISHYLITFIQPFGTLWFIYLLPLFFVTTKLARGLPWYVLLAIGALMQIAPVHTGWMIIDEFASRYIYFLAGYLLAPQLFRLAAWAIANPVHSVAGLVVWGSVNGAVVFGGYSNLPVVSLSLGAMGAVAVVLASGLMSRLPFTDFLRYLGKNSIVVYLAFFLPMGITRLLLAQYAPALDVGSMSAIVTFFGVLVPVVMFRLTQITKQAGFLFRRPAWAYITAENKIPKTVFHPAE